MGTPNILLIVTDEQRHDHLSALGHAFLKTPNMDRLYNEGFIFGNAFCNSPLCVPSRINMMTGQYNMKHGGHGFDEHLHYVAADQPTLVSVLKQAGYRTGLAGKNHTFKAEARDKWFDDWQEYNHHGKQAGNVTKSDLKVRDYLNDEPRPKHRGAFGGKANVMLEGLIPGPMPFDEKECPSWRVGEDACNFIEQDSEQPFFLQVSFPDPHWPNVAPEPYYSMVDPDALDDLESWPINLESHTFKLFVQSQVNDYAGYSEAERKRILATYYGQIMAIDTATGQILEALERSGQAEDTIIVFTADHGNFGGRYGLVGKCGVFCDALLRVPFSIKVPGVKVGASDAMINLIDLAPTLLDACGIDPLPEAQGRSFLPLLHGETETHRDCTFAEVGLPGSPPAPVPHDEFADYMERGHAELGPSWFLKHSVEGYATAVREARWKYCFHTGDNEELYDLENDPMETTNLARNPDYAGEKDRLRTKLFEWSLNEAPGWAISTVV